MRPSWTVRCVPLGEDSFAVLLGLQHLEFDGTSLSVFTDELREGYHGLTDGQQPQLEPAVQYREYALQQHRYTQNGIDGDRSFFEGLFAAVPSTTTMPGHRGFAPTQALPSRRFTPDEPAAAWAQVVDAAGVLEVSPFSVLFATYARLISRLTTSPSVVISMITSARTDPRFAATIGPFTAPFPVPVHVADRSPQELVLQCHRLVSGITARSGYPVTDLPSAVPAFAGFPADTYFTDVGINFTNYRRQDQRHKIRVDVIEILGPVSHPDFATDDFDELRRIPGLHLVADVVRDGLRTNYWYHAHRFRQAEISAWATEHRAIMTETLVALRARSEIT